MRLLELPEVTPKQDPLASRRFSPEPVITTCTWTPQERERERERYIYMQKQLPYGLFF